MTFAPIAIDAQQENGNDEKDLAVTPTIAVRSPKLESKNDDGDIMPCAQINVTLSEASKVEIELSEIELEP